VCCRENEDQTRTFIQQDSSTSSQTLHTKIATTHGTAKRQQRHSNKTATPQPPQQRAACHNIIPATNNERNKMETVHCRGRSSHTL